MANQLNNRKYVINELKRLEEFLKKEQWKGGNVYE